MVLKEWAEVWKLHKESQRRLDTVSRDRTYWFKWICYGVVGLIGAISFWGVVNGWSFVWEIVAGFMVVLGVGFKFWFKFWEVNALAKAFKTECEQHGIDVRNLNDMEQHLRYTLFLRGLVKQEWSHDDITRLKSFAETIRKPEPAFRIGQHSLVVFLMGLFAGALLDAIKQPGNWKGEKGATLIGIGSFLVFFIFVFWLERRTIFTIPNKRHQEIERFLQWAEMDIKEQKAKDTVSG